MGKASIHQVLNHALQHLVKKDLLFWQVRKIRRTEHTRHIYYTFFFMGIAWLRVYHNFLICQYYTQQSRPCIKYYKFYAYQLVSLHSTVFSFLFWWSLEAPDELVCKMAIESAKVPEFSKLSIINNKFWATTGRLVYFWSLYEKLYCKIFCEEVIKGCAANKCRKKEY